MDKRQFKRLLENVLGEYGFKYYSKEKTYYNFSDRLITAIDIQKSSYGDYYYINYGFRITDSEDTIKFPKVYKECDVSARFNFEYDNSEKPDIYLDVLDEETFSKLIEKCIEKEVIPVIEKGINELFVIWPSAVKCLTLRGKRLLGIPE